MRLLFLPTLLLSALLAFPLAAADTAESVRDPRFGLTFRAGFLQAEDDQFSTTWLRPGLLEASAWILRAKRPWLNGVQINGFLGLQSSTVTYSEPGLLTEDRYGLGSFELRVPFGPIGSFGVHFSLYDNRRIRLLAFANATTPLETPEAHVESAELDLEGSLIDITRLARDHARITMTERTYRAGMTLAVNLRSRRERWTPYVTFGWLRYSTKVGVTPDDDLAGLIIALGAMPDALNSYTITVSKPFVSPGLRLDVGRRWSFEVQPLVGRYDGAWVFATQAGITRRFGT